MKIFNDSSSQVRKSQGGEGKKASRKQNRRGDTVEQPHVSDRDIREKLASHVETSNTAKMQMKKNTQKFGEGFLNEEKIPNPIVKEEFHSEEVSIETPIKSDIATNDPRSSDTQEKLKSVLSKGAFSFNPKERDALDRILNAE
jgi:hypothetical protein